LAVRDDVHIHWGQSPRIVEILAPSTDITIQDLLDTCREIEQCLCRIDEDHIIDAAGKEQLEEGVWIAITATLRNAKLKFEDRGSWTTCTVRNGNLVAIDENGDPMNAIEPSAYVNVIVTQSAAGVITGIDASDLAAIKERTDNLPDDPAGLADLEAEHGTGSWQTGIEYIEE